MKKSFFSLLALSIVLFGVSSEYSFAKGVKKKVAKFLSEKWKDHEIGKKQRKMGFNRFKTDLETEEQLYANIKRYYGANKNKENKKKASKERMKLIIENCYKFNNSNESFQFKINGKLPDDPKINKDCVKEVDAGILLAIKQARQVEKTEHYKKQQKMEKENRKKEAMEKFKRKDKGLPKDEY